MDNVNSNNMKSYPYPYIINNVNAIKLSSFHSTAKQSSGTGSFVEILGMKGHKFICDVLISGANFPKTKILQTRSWLNLLIESPSSKPGMDIFPLLATHDFRQTVSVGHHHISQKCKAPNPKQILLKNRNMDRR